MVYTFSPDVFTKGAALSQQSNQNLLDTFGSIAGMITRNKQLKSAKADNLRQQAVKRASDPVYLAGKVQSGQELTPLEAQNWAGIKAIESGKQRVNPLGYAVPKYAPGSIYSPETPQGSEFGTLSAPLQRAQELMPKQIDIPTAERTITPEQFGLTKEEAASPLFQQEKIKLGAKDFAAEQKFRFQAKKDKPKVAKAFRNILEESKDFDSFVEKAIKQSNFGTTGFGSDFARDIIGYTPAVDLGATITRIKSGVGLDEMAELKAQSSTGATGFGALNKEELGLLVNSLANLEQSQSEEQFDENVAKVRDIKHRLVRNTAEDYKRIYGEYPEGYDEFLKRTAEKPTQDGSMEGKTATNPQTGEKMILRGGQWTKL